MSAVATGRRRFTEPDAWGQAFDYIREANRPDVVEIDGHPYKLYPSGRALCAATFPYHNFEGDACGCLQRESGGTIAEFAVGLS